MMFIMFVFVLPAWYASMLRNISVGFEVDVVHMCSFCEPGKRATSCNITARIVTYCITFILHLYYIIMLYIILDLCIYIYIHMHSTTNQQMPKHAIRAIEQKTLGEHETMQANMKAKRQRRKKTVSNNTSST